MQTWGEETDPNLDTFLDEFEDEDLGEVLVDAERAGQTWAGPITFDTGPPFSDGPLECITFHANFMPPPALPTLSEFSGTEEQIVFSPSIIGLIMLDSDPGTCWKRGEGVSAAVEVEEEGDWLLSTLFAIQK